MFELIERMRLPTVLLAEGGGGRPGDTDYAGRLGARHARLRALGAARRAGAADRDRLRPLLRRQRCARRLLGPDRRHRDHRARHGRPGDDRGRRPRDLRARRRSARSRCRRRTGSSTSRSPTRPRRWPPPSACSPTSRARSPTGTSPTRRCCATSSPSAAAAPTTSAVAIEGLADTGSVTLPARALRARDGHRARAHRGPRRRRDRQQPDAARRSDHQRRRRQGGPLHAALRRLRTADRVADRHAGDDGRPGGRGDRPGAPLLAPVRRRREPPGAVRGGDPAQGLRARRPGDGRRAACTSRCSPSAGRPPSSARWGSRAR